MSLVETHGALREVAAIAAHPRIESVSFGLMDFVSAHHGAIPASAMTAQGQFAHPLVLRAKLEIAAACHAFAKTPSHSVVTELTDMGVVAEAARRAARELGYTRMWSIHPSQIRTIVAAFLPGGRRDRGSGGDPLGGAGGRLGADRPRRRSCTTGRATATSGAS